MPGDHFYCTDPNSELAPSSGYEHEGITSYVYKTSQPDTVPIYRWYNPTNGDHFYTTDKNGELGPPAYKSEGIEWYMFNTNKPGTTAVYPQTSAHRLCSWHIRPASKSSGSRYSYRVPKPAFVGEIAFYYTNNIPQTHCHLHSTAKRLVEGFCRHPVAFLVVAECKSHSRDRARNLMLICLL
jgi:hypothetical protein